MFDFCLIIQFSGVTPSYARPRSVLRDVVVGTFCRPDILDVTVSLP